MKPIYISVSIEQKTSDCIWNSGGDINSWLKPITSLSDLPEEWKAEIREIAGKAFEAGEQSGMDSEFGRNTQNDKQEYLKSITL